MSYARWSHSNWYAFYNTSGFLSLWSDMDHITDHSYKDCLLLTAEKIQADYECTADEAIEAMEYVNRFIAECEPKDKEITVTTTTGEDL